VVIFDLQVILPFRVSPRCQRKLSVWRPGWPWHWNISLPDPATTWPEPLSLPKVRHLKMCATFSRSVPNFVVSDTYKLTASAINRATSSSVYYGESDRSRVSCLDAMQVGESQLVIFWCMSSASGPTGTKANAEGRQAAAQLSPAFKLSAPNIQIAFPTCNLRHACVAYRKNGRLERICR